MKISKADIDVSACFLIYVATCGCVDRTSTAMGLSPDVVRALAESENWISKLRKVSLKSNSDGASGEFERITNRALQFIQGNAIRSLVQRILDVMAQQKGHELLATLSDTKAGRVTYSAKFLAELAKASECANHLCLNALSDSVSEREVVKDEEGNLNMSQLHSAVLMALSSPVAAGAERKILEENLEDAVRAIPPKPPTD